MDTTFIDELGSAAPTPGGGGASAYVGALASGLASMVGNLTVGKKTYASVEEAVKNSLETLSLKRQKLLDLINEDACAFEPLARTYRMPKNTPEQQKARQKALQSALIGASYVPLAIMQTCLEVLDQADFLAHTGSKLAISDAGAAALLACAALEAASLNVYINAGALDNENQAHDFSFQADALVRDGKAHTADIMSFVLEQIRYDAG